MRRRWQQQQQRLDADRARLEAALAAAAASTAGAQDEEAAPAASAPTAAAAALAAATAALWLAASSSSSADPATLIQHAALDLLHPLTSAWAAYLRALEEHPLPSKLATGVFGALAGDAIAQGIAWRHKRRRWSEEMDQQQLKRRDGSSNVSSPPPFLYDAPRALRMAAFSALVGTPFAMLEYGLLDGASAAHEGLASAASTIVMPEPTVAEAVVAEAVAVVAPAAPEAAWWAPATTATASAASSSPPLPPLAAAVGKVAADQLVASPAGMAAFFMFVKMAEGKKVGEALGATKTRMWPALVASWKVWMPAQLVNFALVPADLRIAFVNAVAIGWTAYLSAAANDEEE